MLPPILFSSLRAIGFHDDAAHERLRANAQRASHIERKASRQKMMRAMIIASHGGLRACRITGRDDYSLQNADRAFRDFRMRAAMPAPADDEKVKH